MQVARAVAHGPERPAPREKRSSGSRLFGAALSDARVERNLCTTCRGSNPWNQPRLCLHWRPKRQYILHLFANGDVVLNRTRKNGVLCYSMCLTLQRSYRVNLRRDIKDRRIAGPLLTPPRGMDSPSLRCLDTCCFLAKQLHVARKPWIIVLSSNSNFWSCPSVLQLVTLPNIWAMTPDLRGYGDKWRTRIGLLMGWIDSRDRHRFAKHCFTTKGWQMFLHAFRALFALRTLPVFHAPCTVYQRFGFRALHQCQRTVLLQSDSGFCFGRCGVAGSLFSNCTHEGGHLTSHLASARAAPSTTHAVKHNATLSQSRTRLFTTSRFAFFGVESQCASRRCGTPEFSCIWRSNVGIDEVGLIVFSSTILGGSCVSFSASSLYYFVSTI